MARIRKGDLVEIIAGASRSADPTKPRRGRVLRVIPDKSRVVVEGVNLRWKHMRKSQQYPQGGRVQRETPVHVSNVMLVDVGADVRTRVGYGMVKGRKTRIARKTGKPVSEAGKAAAKKAQKKGSGKKKSEAEE
ncbi:MAG: 50S ribosomal protein L24 [Planctomycetota bacterium]|nr:50S ribosomal protein L24 [Planctomycetota bacterium]